MQTIRRLGGFLGLLALAGTATASVNVDSAANYGGSWTHGSNGGGGFGAWSIATNPGTGWAGCGIWDSADASLNLGVSFGFAAKGEGSWIAMDRAFSQAMAAGDTFKLDLGMNEDSGAGGNKGFVLRTSDNREVVAVNQAGSEVITVNGVAALTNYGVGTMVWTFTQVSPTQVAVFATGRGGSETFSATVATNASSFLANIRFYASAITNDEAAERRPVYFDNLRLSQGASDTNLFRYSVAGGRAVITGVLASAAGDIIVPATLGGYAVGAVERSAFQGLVHISSVSFAGGAGVTNIGPMAFQGCVGLTTATLPGGATSLPAGLFQGCVSLETVVLPEGVTNIGAAAFADCRRLAGLTLPSGLTSLGESAFLNCRRLASLHLPAGITSIPGQLCYECRNLSSAGIPSGVTNIGPAAFYNCTGLTSPELPSGVAAIGKDAFKGCAGLAAVDLNGALASVGDEAFFGCESLARVCFRDEVDALGDGVFGACGALAGVYFAGAAPSLGADAGTDLFAGSEGVAVYHHPETAGWPAVPGLWAGRPTALWGAAQDQAIDFPAIGDQVATSTVELAATASSGLAVSFAVGSGPAAISGGTLLSFTGTGVVSIVASQGGDAHWNPAPDVTNWFAVAGGGAALAAVDLSEWGEASGGGDGFRVVVATDPADAEVEIAVEGASVFDAEAQGALFEALAEGTDYEVSGKTVTILPGGTNAWRWYRIRAGRR